MCDVHDQVKGSPAHTTALTPQARLSDSRTGYKAPPSPQPSGRFRTRHQLQDRTRLICLARPARAQRTSSPFISGDHLRLQAYPLASRVDRLQEKTSIKEASSRAPASRMAAGCAPYSVQTMRGFAAAAGPSRSEAVGAVGLESVCAACCNSGLWVSILIGSGLPK